MQDIEPYFRWRDDYSAEDDPQSPFYGNTYNEFQYTHLIYNYYIHPQWDDFGAETIYAKLLFVDYDKNYAILEFIGEWNDALNNDIMTLKDNVLKSLLLNGISKYILLFDNVLNFHSGDDDYYTEWYEEIVEDDGWIVMINTFDHVAQDLKRARLQHYVNFGPQYNDVDWHRKKPEMVYKQVKKLLKKETKSLW